MSLTKEQINQIIMEELHAVLREGPWDTLKAQFVPKDDATSFLRRFVTKKESRYGLEPDEAVWQIKSGSLWQFFKNLDRVKNENVRNLIVKYVEDKVQFGESWWIGSYRLDLSKRQSESWSGDLPRSIGLFTKTRELRIRGQSIGAIPDSFKNLENLKIIDIRGSNLAKLPEWIGMLPNLEELYLYNNKIRSLPKSLVGHQKLKQVGIDHNPIWFIGLTKWFDEIRDSKEEKAIEITNQTETFEGLIALALREGMFEEKLLEGPSIEELTKPEYETDEESDLEAAGAEGPWSKDADEEEAEMQAQAAKDTEVEMRQLKSKDYARRMQLRKKAGLGPEPPKEEENKKVADKIADLEMAAEKIANKLVGDVFAKGTISNLMALGFERKVAIDLSGARIEINKLEDRTKKSDRDHERLEFLQDTIKLAEKEAAKNLLYGEKFDPNKGDPPAGELDVKHLLKNAMPDGFDVHNGKMDVVDTLAHPKGLERPLIWKGIKHFRDKGEVTAILWFDEKDWDWSWGGKLKKTGSEIQAAWEKEMNNEPPAIYGKRREGKPAWEKEMDNEPN